MFTGIIESLGVVEEIEREGTNIHFTLSCDFSSELKVDQSLAHDGVCLTVTECDTKSYRVTAIDETMSRTALGVWARGRRVNLERCVKVGDRLDGHMVQGHVDTIGLLTDVEKLDGSYELTFEHEKKEEWMTVEKGSITVNGMSLTVVKSSESSFSVALIPYTWDHTTMHLLTVGDKVNLEFDIMGKYLSRMLSARS
jgi:riboflavin synthase